MAGSYDSGDRIRLKTSTAFNVDGVATDPTTITVQIKKPDGTVLTYVYGVDAEVVRDGVGLYHVDINLDQVGTWYYRFAGTGACVAAAETEFYVLESEFA